MKLHFTYVLLLVAVVLSAASCSKDTESKSLSAPQITLTQVTYNTLAFSWKPIEGATQYGYKLTLTDGKAVAGEVTSDTTVTFSGLEMLTDYELHLWAYPTIETPQLEASGEVVMQARTPFYSVINTTGTMESIFLSSALEDIAIEEVRTEEDRLGVFTIKAFYGKEGKDLIFSVNEDQTINILNEDATVDTATGYKKVPTGAIVLTIKNGVLIDESQSTFDRQACTLTLYVKSTKGNKEGTDTFTWNE